MRNIYHQIDEAILGARADSDRLGRAIYLWVSDHGREYKTDTAVPSHVGEDRYIGFACGRDADFVWSSMGATL